MAAFWVKLYRGMRLPFWNVFLSSQWPPFPVPVSWHMHVQIHFSWREDPLLLSLCSCWACSLFYEMPLTLAHIPSISRSCTDACPEPYGCAFIWSHLWRSHLAAFSHRGPGGGGRPLQTLCWVGHMHMKGPFKMHLHWPLLYCHWFM